MGRQLINQIKDGTMMFLIVSNNDPSLLPNGPITAILKPLSVTTEFRRRPHKVFRLDLYAIELRAKAGYVRPVEAR